MKDQRGVVYLETLVAFVPVFLFFLGTLQVADAGAAHLIVKHAATVAARAAVVVLPDDGVYYNDKDNEQIHQFTGLRRDDIEHAADLVLGANARLDGASDNVSIGFSAPPIPTPAGETNAEKSRSFGERLLDTSNRGQGEQNMRELVTARVKAKYTCLVAALCPRDLNMVGQASLVYQGARYIYEARTNGARNAAHSHNTNGGLVNTADQNHDGDPNAADGDGEPSDPDAANSGRPPAQGPDNPVANATPPGSRPPANPANGRPPGSSTSGAQPGSRPPNAPASNGSNANANNANANNANANNSNANANNANASANNANASANNANANNTNASNSSNTSAASGSNRHASANSSNTSKPHIVARPPADGSPVSSASPPANPSGTPVNASNASTPSNGNGSAAASSSEAASKGNRSTPGAQGDQHREVAAAAPPPKRDDPRVPVATRGDGNSSSQAGPSRPGAKPGSPRGPPTAQSVVAGTSKDDSTSHTVDGRTTPGDKHTGTSASTILASAASRPTRDPSILGVDSQGRTHLVVTNPACFIAGTQIRTAHGSKRIEALAAGDRVLAFDLTTHTTVERPVLHSFTRKTNALIDLEVDIAGATSLITGTPEHPFFVPSLEAFVPMGELTPGTLLTTHSGISARVRTNNLRRGDFDVFNLQVAEHHNYFVAAAGGDSPGVLVHNAGCGGPRPSAGDEGSAREPVRNSPLANQNIAGHPGPHQVFQVGNAWREPLPEYRNRAPADIPVDGYRDYRMVEVVDANGRVIAQREETYVQPANSSPYWMQRGSASTLAGGRMERASSELDRDLIASGEIAAAFNTQNASGQGFDGVTLSYDNEGNPQVTLVEVKDYPGRYIGFDELSAVNQNLDQNLDALRALVQDEQAAETLGLTPEQLDAVRQALDNGNVGIEVRPGPTTRVGARSANPSNNAGRPRVVDALQNLLNERGLSGGVNTRQIPQNVVDRVPGNPGIGTQPRFYGLARGPNGEITHESVQRANQQLARDARN
ncbi:MAG TPA: polymorphic toxin-type HINT domain-containing protein [Polyangiales bacterium]|nr:polymorphic toxin-type HINT domain-containing protein [Polyangiales bacterium]